MFIRTLTLSVLASFSLSLAAGDFSPLLDVARSTWPEKTSIGVLCDYRTSSAEIQQLAQAAGSGMCIQVVDLPRRELLFEGMKQLIAHQPDYVVLLTRDRLVPDYSAEATLLVRYLASHGIPTISMSSVALRQGAVFALGDRTGGVLRVCSKPIGTIRVALPTSPSLASAKPEGSAQIQLASMR